jgi:hypothetical protein
MDSLVHKRARCVARIETEKMGFSGGTVSGQLLIGNTGSLAFEGSTVDAYELTLAVADPQGSDKTITFPDVTGNVVTTGDTGTVTSVRCWLTEQY